MIGTADFRRADARIRCAFGIVATLTIGPIAAESGTAFLPIPATLVGHVAKVPTSAAAELFSIAIAVTAGAIATRGHADQAAIGAARFSFVRRADAFAIERILFARTVDRRWGRAHRSAGGIGFPVQQRLASNNRATEPKQPLDESAPVGRNRQTLDQCVEPSIIHRNTP